MPLFNPATVESTQQINVAENIANSATYEVFFLNSSQQTSNIDFTESVVPAFPANPDRIGQQIWVPDTSSTIIDPSDFSHHPIDPDGYILFYFNDVGAMRTSMSIGAEPSQNRFLKLTPGSYWEPPVPYTGDITAIMFTESTTAGISFAVASYQK